MGELRPHFGPIHKHPDHGGNVRGARPIPRRHDDWESRNKQSLLDRSALQRAIREKLSANNKEGLNVGNDKLPAYKHKQEIISFVDHYKAVILGGPTGSGKSTQVPQFLYEAGFDKTYLLVPRRIIADGLVDRLREELSEHIGDQESEAVVGVVHGERAEFSDDNKIVIMTPNTFIRMEPDIRERYSDQKVAIVSDEIHEANLYTEIATGVAAQSVHENDDWHLVLSSATHNKGSLHTIVDKLNQGIEPIVKTDNQPLASEQPESEVEKSSVEKMVVPVIDIEGRPFEIEKQEAPEETPMEVYARMGENHQKTIIFTSGKSEIDHMIEETRRMLDARQPGSSKDVVFRKLHGELTEFELSHINDPVAEGKRVVIVSSPAGMSGITISGVTLSIVDGTINRPELDEESKEGLNRSYSSQAEIIQMFGRAGRDLSGGIGVLAKPIAVEEDKIRARKGLVEVEQMPFVPFDERQAYGPPEIYHTNLSGVVLSVAALERRFAEINDYIPNSVEDLPIIQAGESLQRLGAFDDEKITDIGRNMSRFPIRPELSRGLVEALNQNRPLQHLTQLAIISAALSAGGMQEFNKYSGREWQKLIRPETKDDVIAQLDIATEFPNFFDKQGDIRGVQPYIGADEMSFLRRFDLSYKRVQQTRKVTGKILKELGIHQPNVVLDVPNSEEAQLLRDDLTAGMIDSVYRKATVEHRKQYYQNIHGDEESKKRYISERSVVDPNQHDYVAGMARWFETNKRDGSRNRHNVIELLYPVSPKIVGQYAVRNHLLIRKPLESTFIDGQVVGRYQPMFGSIPIGKPEQGQANLQISEADRQLLVSKVFESRSSYALRALLDLATELETYKNRLPNEIFKQLINEAAPEILTKQKVQALVYEATSRTDNLNGVDEYLQQYIYEENLDISRYFDLSARDEIALRTPDDIKVGDDYVRVHYDKGTPYVTLPNSGELRDKLLAKPHYLLDGREVLVQQPLKGGGSQRLKVSQDTSKD